MGRIPKSNVKSDEVGSSWKANTWIKHNKEDSDEGWLQEWYRTCYRFSLGWTIICLKWLNYGSA